MGILEKIKEIEHEMKITQKNKATSSHLGLLKARLCKLRRQLLNPDGGKASSGPGEGFAVAKSGDARVALIGFPSVGKSSLLAKLTDTKSEAAAYEFTTLTCIPGNGTLFFFNRRLKEKQQQHSTLHVQLCIMILKSNFWIYLELLKVLRTVRVEVEKLSRWRKRRTLF